MKDEKIVMYESPEAAQIKSVTGWVSITGQFCGNDEHMARWLSCTHRLCEKCGAVKERNNWCEPCRKKRKDAEFFAFPVEEWDESTPVCMFDDDRYFFDKDALLDYMADLYDTAKAENAEPDIKLVLCVPGKLHLLSSDYWYDDLPEDGELPDEVQKKLDELNDAISNAAPVCWWPGEVRIKTDEWWDKIRKEREGGKCI